MVNKFNLEEMQAAVNSRQLKESKPREQKPRNEEMEWNLWEMMTTLFHQAWTSREGEEPTEIWGQLLTELSPDQINSGFDKLLSWESAFPPTVLQFRQLCLPATISPNGGNQAAYIMIDDPKHPHYQSKQIESDAYVSKRKKAGRSALDAMKGLFPDVGCYFCKEPEPTFSSCGNVFCNEGCETKYIDRAFTEDRAARKKLGANTFVQAKDGDWDDPETWTGGAK